MKKIFFSIILSAFAMGTFAQTGWETPTQNQQDQQTERKALFGSKPKYVIPEKYNKGAVTEENGKVCWTKTFNVPGKSANEVYDIMLAAMHKFVKTEEQSDKSVVAVVNNETHQIGVRLAENLVFASKALSLDQTDFFYHLLISCKDGSCTVKMTHLAYHYEKGRPSEVRYTAEEMISDAVSFNKKGDKYTKGGTKKFREKTIDRKDQVFAWIERQLK